MKSEARNPKAEGKPEIRRPKGERLRPATGAIRREPFRVSGFGFPSDFGFRASDLIWLSLNRRETNKGPRSLAFTEGRITGRVWGLQ